MGGCTQKNWEILPPQVRPLLQRLDVWDAFAAVDCRRADGIVSCWGAGQPHTRDFIAEPYGYGWYIDRSSFDRMLLRATEEVGVQLMLRSSSSKIERDRDGWRLIIDSPEGSQHISSRFLIDARGRSTRRTDGNSVVYDRLAAAIRYFDARSITTETFTIIEACEYGWFYSAFVADDRLMVVFLSDPSFFSGGRRHVEEDLVAALSSAPLTSRRQGSLAALGPPRIVIAKTGISLTGSDPSLVRVGDASYVLDPLSGQGLCHALGSALAAATAVNAHLRGAAESVPRYWSAQSIEFCRQLIACRDFYAREQRWPVAEFWRRRSDALQEKLQPQAGSALIEYQRRTVDNGC
jgi:2-polyprenyl-6-methoxyphenol hydroxylase-like FAD-dependent oxidoreductase